MTEAQFIGMTLIALGTIIGLFTTVAKPIVKAATELTKEVTNLNSSIVDMKEDIKEIRGDIKENAAKSHKSHERLWKHNEEQDTKIEDHEKRIFYLEHKE